MAGGCHLAGAITLGAHRPSLAPVPTNRCQSGYGAHAMEEKEATATKTAPSAEFIKKMDALQASSAGKARTRTGPVTHARVWDWFGNAEVFLGAEPLTEQYKPSSMVDPRYTPFERFYVVEDAPGVPLLALRLRPFAFRDARIHDPLGRIVTRKDMKDGVRGLALYTLDDDEEEDNVPEPYTDVSEDDFLAHFGARATRWV